MEGPGCRARNANADRATGGAGVVRDGRPAVAHGDPNGRPASLRILEARHRSFDVAEPGIRDRLSALGNDTAGTDARRASGFPFDGRARLHLSTDRAHGACGATLSG